MNVNRGSFRNPLISVCGGCLALMDAGVKIKKPVAGVAMGLITDAEHPNDRYAILTDILGDEDHQRTS